MTDQFDEALANPEILNLMSALMKAASWYANGRSIDPDLLCDALSFFHAMVLEAEPDCQGENGLKEAYLTMARNNGHMLHKIRSFSDEQGCPFLHSVNPLISLN